MQIQQARAHIMTVLAEGESPAPMPMYCSAICSGVVAAI